MMLSSHLMNKTAGRLLLQNTQTNMPKSWTDRQVNAQTGAYDGRQAINGLVDVV